MAPTVPRTVRGWQSWQRFRDLKAAAPASFRGGRARCVLFCWTMLLRLRHLIPAIGIAVVVGPVLAQAEEHTFRIRFGLTDFEPTAWDGSVTVSGGRVASLRSWRPRGADEVGASSWKLSTTPGRQFRYRNWEPEPSFPVPAYLNLPGLILAIDTDGDARVDIDTAAGDFSFRLSEQPPGARVTYLGGGAVVERAANYRSVSDQTFHNGFADVAADRNGAHWVAWVGYRDWANHVFVRHHDGSGWGEIQEVTSGPSDVYYVRLAVDGQGGVLAVWSDRKDAGFDLYSRRFDGESWSATERLTQAGGPDIHHAVAADSLGGVWLVWQGYRNGSSDVFARRWNGVEWGPEARVSLSPSDDWHPAIAADSKGGVYVAWETYENNDYDIRMRKYAGGQWSAVEAVADTSRYEAYPSLACDNQDRLWAAWNESGTQWGKDTGFLLNRPATQLYQSRWIATAVYENGQWREPMRTLEGSLPPDLRQFNDFPRLQTDGSGRVWALFRHRHLRQREVPHTAAAHRASWETYATAFDGRTWSQPLPIPATAGRSDAGAGFAAGPDGRLFAAWATDNRIYDDYFYGQGEVFATGLPVLDGPVYDAQLKLRQRDELETFVKHPNESRDIARIRSYVIESEGKTYKIYRGDTHRHTEYSGDGNNDGAQNDTYRYALNVADLDYLGMSEHHNSGGPNIEYINWLLQQRVDVFHVPGRFVPLFGYERGVGYPNGHRNVLFAKRGNPTFPDQPNERGHLNRGCRPVRLPQALRRHLDPAHVSDQHGYRLARQRPRSGAARRDLSGGPHLVRVRRGTEGSDGGRCHQSGRRLPSGGLCLERVGQGLQDWRSGQLRPPFDAHLVLVHDRGGFHARRAARRDAQAPQLRRHGQYRAGLPHARRGKGVPAR